MLLSCVAVVLQALLLFGTPSLAPSPPGASPVAVATRPAATAGQPSGSGTPGLEGQTNPHPTLTVPPPPGVAIPEGAVLLYTQSPNPPASPRTSQTPKAPEGPKELHRPLTPQDLLLGILDLHARGKLDLTPAQARRLADEVRDLDRAVRGFAEDRLEVLDALNNEQRAWLEANPPGPADLPPGAPEENALNPAQRALQALDQRQ